MTAVPPPTVVTVTVNPAIDHTLWIPGFRAGEVNRVQRDEQTPGGKGVNVAAFLAALGVRVAATGFLGTDNAGLFERFFSAKGIDDRFVRVPGATRTGIKIVDEDGSSTTDINFPGVTLNESDLAALETEVAQLAAEGPWVVGAGSLPPTAPRDLYRQLGTTVHAAGGAVALDTSGPPLAHGLECRPDLVKPNRAELEELVDRRLDDRAGVLTAADELVGGGVDTVIVSLGSDGALFVTAASAVFAAAMAVDVVSTVGAGDAMVAGTIAARLRGLPLSETAALATACSAAAISTVGPYLDPEKVEAMAGSIEIDELR